MKKMIDKIFVYAYTGHYERNNNDPRIDPTGIASAILGVCIGCWIIAINGICSFLFKYDYASTKLVIAIIAVSLISGGLLNNYFLDDNRALNLYKQYKASASVKTAAQGMLRVLIFILAPFVVLIIFILIFNVIGIKIH